MNFNIFIHLTDVNKRRVMPEAARGPRRKVVAKNLGECHPSTPTLDQPDPRARIADAYGKTPPPPPNPER